MLMSGKFLVLFALLAVFAVGVSSKDVVRPYATDVYSEQPKKLTGGAEPVEKVRVAKRKLCNAHNLICNLWR
ncbi:hypothetical protein QR680_000261 [Steinernema hermaphroditum]|uniref:Uncharacterized protein n=1 Tax=Steinernema hermaphroditum TaxID=289476 RepID=A0AA39GU02_9BILA|nr:hypothetical protein QR680_000261 [Steinernema hermaphroditum]